MSFLDERTKDVSVGDDNIVTLKYPSFGWRQRVLSKYSIHDTATGQVKIDSGMIRFEQLRSLIASWRGPDFDGYPVSDEMIERLPVHIADILLEAIDGMQVADNETKKL